MPLFFFDLVDHERSRDEAGTELASLDAARVQAVTFLAEYLRDHPQLVWDGREQRVVVREGDAVVFTAIVLTVDGVARTIPSGKANMR